MADVVEVEVLDAGHARVEVETGVQSWCDSGHDDHLRVQRTMKRMTKMAQWRLW